MQMGKQTPVSPVQEIQLGTEDLLCFSMNIFGKNKAPSELPPEPPKRPDVQGEAVPPSLAEEEEEEALYIYEAPPREEPAKKGSVVQPQEPEEGTYLDCPNLRRFSLPVNLHSKPCMLLAKPGAEDSDDEGTINIQALEEALKKGLMKSPQPPSLPPSARRVSLPASAFSGHQTKVAINNDVFLATEDDKDEPQDQPIYLECEASTGVVPSKGPSSPVLDPLTCLLKQAKSKISSLGSQQDPDMKNAAWYAGNCDRRTAEAALLQFNKNSAFMVRQSSRRSPRQPFTLVVFYKNHIYNVPIHYQESSCQFALGKDGKSHERQKTVGLQNSGHDLPSSSSSRQAPAT
ncbi:B-cell linker protein-like isoform X3 [Crotalus tigris]|uniref:B-cell linker protein-like isoform X3 n=1 Tax=Crotalus tigris TaxID=88082 RepID=UPI00192F4730|nr:B-cell linker protein-like isoform X3 [Crotalus tigris]